MKNILCSLLKDEDIVLLLADINKLGALLIKRAMPILHLELATLQANAAIFKAFNKKIDFNMLDLASSADVIKHHAPMLFQLLDRMSASKYSTY